MVPKAGFEPARVSPPPPQASPQPISFTIRLYNLVFTRLLTEEFYQILLEISPVYKPTSTKLPYGFLPPAVNPRSTR